MEKKISIQRQKIQNGNPTIELINPCRIGFGIEQITDRQKKKAINNYISAIKKSGKSKKVAKEKELKTSLFTRHFPYSTGSGVIRIY